MLRNQRGWRRVVELGGSLLNPEVPDSYISIYSAISDSGAAAKQRRANHMFLLSAYLLSFLRARLLRQQVAVLKRKASAASAQQARPLVLAGAAASATAVDGSVDRG